MTEDTILSAIGSTEPSDFNEFCRGLGADCPDDREGWREVFNHLRILEQHGFIEVSRTGNKIDSMILTKAGANRIREKLDSRRGLFAEMSHQ
jgi:DNA-binding transcriptional ArsR family regulator